MAAVASDSPWRDKYQVGDKVQFSVSENVADSQTCTVSENHPNSVMKVNCNPFRQWAGGNYIVYGQGNLTADRAPAAAANSGNPNQQQSRIARPAPVRRVGGSLKPGEYACYGTGGRIMIGLSFKVNASGRYTDLEGGNAGTVSIRAGKVIFSGGHMGGQVGRMLGAQNFAIGQQAECEPY